jgi:hypothetical protein
MESEPGIDLGSAGASGRREYERRRANREARTLERHPRVGKLLLKLQDSPQHERAWETGASGEEMLAASLLKRCPDAMVLHDRRIPGSRANIDHLAIAPSGVHVIDSKRYKGKIEVRRPIFGGEQLVIRGRDKTKLIDTLEWQQETVQKALASIGEEVPVHACLCFLNPDGQMGGTDIPMWRTLKVRGYPLYVPRKLAKQLTRPGRFDAEHMQRLTHALVAAFPPA